MTLADGGDALWGDALWLDWQWALKQSIISQSGRAPLAIINH